MPNYCDYLMRVKGRRNNVDAFVTIMQADYNEVPKHFWRVFEADVCDEHTENGIKTVDIGGCCAWSVHSCMRDGVGTYNTDYETGENASHGTTLEEQSKLLNLEIEVYSSEPGMGFQEHYLYKNGEELIDECIDYLELFFETEEEFNEEKEEGCCSDYTWNDVDEDGYIRAGGYSEWKFQI